MGISNLIYDSWMKDAQYKKYSGILPMLKRAGVQFGKMLDVGIGTGLFEDYLKGQGAKFDAIGIEPDEKMKREAEKKGYKVTVGTSESLPFEDSTFDFVACIDALHLAKDKRRAITEMLRVLRPRGFLLVSHFCNTFNAGEVTKTLESATEGLNIVDKKMVGQNDAELAVAFLIRK
ncbi:MAG: class I SAM-dependent methyltransferase [Candidatus Diapherotrites archaeon]|nr:class I SAM-dependent methyltransferase [Candidatus Diapherotrites archaeon]